MERPTLSFQDFHNALADMYTQRPDALTYAILGVAGESGEVCEVFKKILRIKSPDPLQFTVEERRALIDELGDVLWYTAKVAKILGCTIEDVASTNMTKLARRRATGSKHTEGAKPDD